MPQLNPSFDLGSQTVIRAGIDGRVAGVVSVVLTKSLAKLATREGGNLSGEYEGPTQSLAQAQLDIARAFGYAAEATSAAGPRS